MQEKKSKIIHLAIALNNLHHRISILVKINTVILHMFLLQWLKNSAFPRNTNAVENVHCSCFFSFLSIVCVCVCMCVCVWGHVVNGILVSQPGIEPVAP